MVKVVAVCYGEGSLGRSAGVFEAPWEVLKEMEDIWLSESGKSHSYTVIDSGVKNGMDYSELVAQLKRVDGELYVGGDHSITYALFLQYCEKNPNAGLVVFDAHPECFQQFQYPTHGDWILHLIRSGVSGDRIILVGLRASSPEEQHFLKENGIRYFSMSQIFGNEEGVCDSLMEMCRNFEKVYVSVDVDVVDPGMAPGTGYLEPGGMTGRQLLYFIQRLRKMKNFGIGDIVEVNPQFDVRRMTVKLAARLVYELLG